MVCNAQAKLAKPAVTNNVADPLLKDRVVTLSSPVRCRVVPVSAQQHATVAGTLTNAGWSCRLRSTEQIQPGWRVQIQRDDWTSYREFEVTSAICHGYHWHLMLSGGVG